MAKRTTNEGDKRIAPTSPADHMAGGGFTSTQKHTGQVESGEGPAEAWRKLAPAHATDEEPLVPEEVLAERNPVTGRPAD